MKKLLSFTLVAGFVVALAACSPRATEETTSRPARVETERCKSGMR